MTFQFVVVKLTTRILALALTLALPKARKKSPALASPTRLPEFTVTGPQSTHSIDSIGPPEPVHPLPSQQHISSVQAPLPSTGPAATNRFSSAKGQSSSIENKILTAKGQVSAVRSRSVLGKEVPERSKPKTEVKPFSKLPSITAAHSQAITPIATTSNLPSPVEEQLRRPSVHHKADSSFTLPRHSVTRASMARTSNTRQFIPQRSSTQKSTTRLTSTQHSMALMSSTRRPAARRPLTFDTANKIKRK